MNSLSNQQIKKSIPQIIALGEGHVRSIEAQFEKLTATIKDAIMLQYLLNQNDSKEGFGLRNCLDDLIEELQDYSAQVDDEEIGWSFLLEKMFSTLVNESREQE
jgi:hypothetical protein